MVQHRRPRRIELNILAGLNEIFPAHPAGENLKKTAEDLFFRLAQSCPTAQLQQIDPIFQKLAILMCVGESALLTLDEENRLVNVLENIKENLGSPDFKIDNLPRHLNDLIKRLIDNNCKAKVIFLLTKMEYLLYIHPPENAFPVNIEQLDAILNPIKKALRKANFSDFETLNIAKELELIIKMIKENPKETDLALKNLTQLKDKILKNLPQ